MSEVPTARAVADGLRGRLTGLWEVFGQRLVRHELHFNGTSVELERGPIELEGYAIRLLRPGTDQTGVGTASSNDLSPAAFGRTLGIAEESAKRSAFPARGPQLPTENGSGAPVQNVDPKIRDAAAATISELGASLVGQYPMGDVTPSFGSIRVTHARNSVVNSGGVERSWEGTAAEFEWAVKASGGPEGRAPGEYWVNSLARRADPGSLGIDVARWATLARDVRLARPPAAGPMNVVFPPAVVNEIVPPVLSFRLTGAAELRKMATPVGTAIGSPSVTFRDDPHLPWGLATSPFDDEGRPTHARSVIEEGVVRSHYYDALHGSALRQEPNGWGRRGLGGYPNWFRFIDGLGPGPSNFVVPPGKGGTDAEMIEAAGEGLWLEQLGYAFPDPIAGAYGGEIRIGYRIHRGKLAEPVRGGTVGGLVVAPAGTPSLLNGVTSVGSSPVLMGSFQTASWLAKDTPVAGPQ